MQTVKVDDRDVIAIHVPRAEYNLRPVYINNNPMRGTYCRNHEGDYHCTDQRYKMMVRDSRLMMALTDTFSDYCKWNKRD